MGNNNGYHLAGIVTDVGMLGLIQAGTIGSECVFPKALNRCFSLGHRIT
jgi:hypothetical protein